MKNEKLEQMIYSICGILNHNFHFQNVNKELEGLSRFLRFNKVKINSALDVGCGNGHITEELRKILGLNEIYGLDLNKRVLEQAKCLGIKTIHGDMSSININAQYDLVISYGSLHHSKNIENFIRNLKKLSSKYILIVDNTVRDIFVHKITGSRYFPLEPSPFSIRSREEIIRAITKVGCEIVAMQTNFNANIWHDRSFILTTN
ncbi:MAG: class I SAM-dependent methyltransferase [Candidatus Heimdallarchaeota archaeon]